VDEVRRVIEEERPVLVALDEVDGEAVDDVGTRAIPGEQR
jgi:hypothetical protein